MNRITLVTTLMFLSINILLNVSYASSSTLKCKDPKQGSLFYFNIDKNGADMGYFNSDGGFDVDGNCHFVNNKKSLYCVDTKYGWHMFDLDADIKLLDIEEETVVRGSSVYDAPRERSIKFDLVCRFL